MKNYCVSDYQDWVQLSIDLTTELMDTVAVPVAVEHQKFGNGIITAMTVALNEAGYNILTSIDFADQTKKLALNILMANGLIKVAEPENEQLRLFIQKLDELLVEVKNVHHDRMVAKNEADRKAAEEAKQEAKYQAAKEKAIYDFEVMTRKDKSVSATGEFYYNLGWLAKNVGTISAALPDYLLKYFENHFGTEAKPTVVDSRKRTINGNPMQWALSMKASVSKKAIDSIPPFLKQYLNTTNNALTNTTFVWDLVENHGFRFGKKQDVDQIRATVPTHCIEYFEKGFVA